MLEVLATAIRQEKETKGIQIGKKSNYSYCRWHGTVYYRSQNSARKLEMLNKLSNSAGHRIKLYKSIAFLYTKNEHTREITDYEFLHNSLKENKISRNKLN